jgi:signal transduction histidine kinase
VSRRGRRSLGHRLIRVNALTGSVALLLACGACLAYEFITFRRGMVSSLETHADIIAANAESALLFNDMAAANRTLAAMRAEPHIINIHLVGEAGQPFASYARAGAARVETPRSLQPPNSHRFDQGRLVLSRPVLSEGSVIGTIYIEADLEEMVTRLKRYTGIVAGVLVFSLVIGLLLSARLQRGITRPIFDLAAAARTVSGERDYTVRVDVTTDDELGRLTGTFNEMLAQIEHRDRELMLARDELERRVEARTRALQQEVAARMRLAEQLSLRNRELIAQNELVQEATRMKSEFLANMSHELRTPLNAIIGFSELLHDGKVPADSPEHGEFLAEVLNASRHLLVLINDVLDLAKVEAGKMDFMPESFDLRALAEEVRDTLRTMASRKKLRIDIDVAPDLTSVYLDRSRLKQVFYNYLSNAVKFTGEDGSIVIRVQPEGSDEFRLEVEDTGIGIRDEDLGGLFVEFHQLDSTAAKKYAGTGLGLALTKRILHAQGGRHGVRSVHGKGSTFYAVLPRTANGGGNGGAAMAGGES